MRRSADAGPLLATRRSAHRSGPAAEGLLASLHFFRGLRLLQLLLFFGYLGLLVGPPLVGIVAQLTSLRVSFVVLALIAAAVAAVATRLRL